jgi:NAD(P)-dependent dehydrogenase (short-subunit alcohol dehydrogenase family)
MGNRLKGRTAVITGSSRGIGAAIAEKYASEGCNVVINYLSSPDKAEEIRKNIEGMGAGVISVKADVSKREEVETLLLEAKKKFDRVDILVNNAGIGRRTPFLEIDEEEWDLIFKVIVKGYFLCGQVFGRHMAENGSGKIINISSISKYIPDFSRAHYCSAKGAVGMLTKSMAYELSPLGINVNEIVPGAIKTDIDIAFKDEEKLKKIESRVFIKGVGEPADIAGAAVFLASDESDYLTGSEILIDGGYLLYKRDKIR